MTDSVLYEKRDRTASVTLNCPEAKNAIDPSMHAAPCEIVDLGLGGLTRGLHTIRKPVIAAEDGWALAGGFELALACDLRIASERARFGSFEARRGFR